MQILQGVLSIFGKQTLVSLALDILWKALGKLATDAMIYVQEAETHPEFSAQQKRDYVIKAMAVKYGNLRNWKWLINVALELAVGKLKDATGAAKSAAIIKVG